jgi:hypothetical protein
MRVLVPVVRQDHVGLAGTRRPVDVFGRGDVHAIAALALKARE